MRRPVCLRLDESLVAAIKTAAQIDGRSMTQWITRALYRALAEADARQEAEAA